MSQGNPVSRNHPEPGVLGDSGNSECRVSPGTRITGDSRKTDYEWPGEHGFPEDTGTRSTGWLRLPGVSGETGNPERSEWIRENGKTPYESGNTEFWVKPGSQSSGCLRETGVLRVTPGTGIPPVDSQEHGVPGDPRNKEFGLTPEARSSRLPRERGVLQGLRAYGVHLVTTGNRSSGRPRGAGVRITPVKRSSGWLRELVFRVTRGTRIPGYSGNV